ncbi:MAG: NAD-dependent epimerase/dehydratase family protein [Fimbriimonas sp.]|jgi:nucleoside-diphosphate-sugar epimerase|nr:NAD-dependent epimerase/dehydratase family protein [Fimbriimonas sp.]
MRIGVTGGGGFLGRSLVIELTGAGHEVVVLDEREVNCWRQVYGRAFDGDLKRVFAGCDLIFHLEWSGSFRQAKEDPVGTRQRNLTTVHRVLDCVVPVVFTSTSLVYGGNLAHPSGEEEDVAPRAPYGEQKLEAERLVREAGGCAVRVFNLYGPNSTDPAQIIPRLITAARGDGRVSLNGDGLQKRDFVHRIDAAKALLELASRKVAGNVFNLSSGIGTTMIDLVNLVFAEAGREPEITWNPPVAGEARMICGDPTALKQLTQWEPTIQLSEGIRTLLAHPS